MLDAHIHVQSMERGKEVQGSTPHYVWLTEEESAEDRRQSRRGCSKEVRVKADAISNPVVNMMWTPSLPGRKHHSTRFPSSGSCEDQSTARIILID